MDRNIARQHLETSRLMGVDFLPVAPSSKSLDTDNRAPIDLASNPLDTDNRAPIDQASKQVLLEQLRQAHDSTCPHCTKTTGYTQTVFGTGHPNASLMFIGEAPGAEEDLRGIPFVGAAGHKLDEIIASMQMRREDVYIANVLKSRPPNNRTPLPDEIARCGSFLKQQIAIVEPDVIVTLGSPASKYILGTNQGITRLRGTWGRFGTIPVMPTFHPAYLLRNYTVETRSQVWSDMQQVISILFP